MRQRIKMGMIGGGKGAFIGAVHRMAANLDGLIELSCGCFSSHPENSLETGRALFLPENRIYKSYQDLIEKESSLPAEEKVDFISIVTPNFAHFEPIMLALESGFHVLVDKPMTISSDEARKVVHKIKETGLLCCLTHTYSGYPMVKQAKNMIHENYLGEIRKVYVEYPQGWLSESMALTTDNALEKGMDKAIHKVVNKQADWRMDPKRSGPSGCMGDIGTHAAHLAEYITGLPIISVCASLNQVVEGRKLDDDGAMLLKFQGGATGVLIASQIANGEENSLTIKVYGEKGGMEWHQMEPNTLIFKSQDNLTKVYRTGGTHLSESAKLHTRLPAGHPEGYLEAFANLYRNFATHISCLKENKFYNPKLDYPNENDGLKGLNFIEGVVASNNSEKKWFDLSNA